MSKINIQTDLFLAFQELNRNQKFIVDEGFVRIFKALINQFGIVNVDEDAAFDNFKVQAGTNSGTIKISQDSYAIDKDINIIFQKSIDNMGVVDDSNWYWLKISHKTTNEEMGTVNVATNGDLTGVGTLFTDVLRDQSNYPVKVNFPNSTQNVGDYQVVSVLSDTQAILSGTTAFISENGLEYQIVGSYTPGINPSGTNRLPYIYDGCNFEFIPELSVDVPPAKTEGKEFYLARIMNSGGSIMIQDKRSETASSSKSNSGWITPTLGVEFTNVVGKEVQYRINYIGEVEIRGTFTTTDGTATLFTLPVTPQNARPANNSQGIYGYDDGSVIRIITADTNGAIKASTTFPFSITKKNEIISFKIKTA